MTKRGSEPRIDQEAEFALLFEALALATKRAVALNLQDVQYMLRMASLAAWEQTLAADAQPPSDARSPVDAQPPAGEPPPGPHAAKSSGRRRASRRAAGPLF